MTDNEIVKAWQKILSMGDAPIGEHWSVGVVTTKLAKETLDMLNRQKAEIERLQKNEQIATAVITKSSAEIENLKKFCNDFSETLSNNCKKADLEKVEAVDKAKSEAVREFAERLKNLTACYWLDNINVGHIDKLVKEMVGDENG